MAYRDFKDLAKRTSSDKVLRDKAFNIAKNHKYDQYQKGLASMVYKFFDKSRQVVVVLCPILCVSLMIIIIKVNKIFN